MINFHSFCLSGIAFLFPSHLKDNFGGYIIPAGGFSFNILNI